MFPISCHDAGSSRFLTVVLSVALWSLMPAPGDQVSLINCIFLKREKSSSTVQQSESNLALFLTPNLGWRAEGRGDAPLAHAVITAAAPFLFPQFVFGLHLPLLTLDFHLLYCKTRGKHLDLCSQQLCNFHLIKGRFINLTLFLFSWDNRSCKCSHWQCWNLRSCLDSSINT